MRADDAEERTAGPVKKKSRQEQALALVAERGSVACGDVALALGITSTYAAVLLGSMVKAGQIKREGVPMHYRYTKA